MRVAVAGKGGAGKTTISATLARLVARTGRPVVAVDADANPNLALALGLAREAAARMQSLPAHLVSRRLGGPGLTEPLAAVLDRFAVAAPDGIRLLMMGAPDHADTGCLCSAHAVVSAVLEDLGDDVDRLVLVDMEASPEHLSRGTVRHADAVLLVAEPYYRSLETVRRLAALAAELAIPRIVVVANKVRSDGDAQAVAEFCSRHGFDLAGTVPWSDAVGAADLRRDAVVDSPGAETFVEAVAALGNALGVPTRPAVAP